MAKYQQFDAILEKWATRLVFAWGPFYAVLFFLRFLWREYLRREEE